MLNLVCLLQLLMNRLSNILQYPLEFRLKQRTTITVKTEPDNKTEINYFQECDSFNINHQKHYSFKKNNEKILQNNLQNQNHANSQNNQQSLYISYKINQKAKNVPDFVLKCKLQEQKSNRASPNFKQSLIKIQQNESPLQMKQKQSSSHQHSYQNQQSINPFKKSSQFKKMNQIKASNITSIIISPKRLFYQNQDTFEQLLKRQNHSSSQNDKQSMMIDDLQSQNIFTPYKVNPIRNKYLADRSISSIERQFQRDLDQFSSKPQLNQSQNSKYKPFRHVAEQFLKPSNLQFQTRQSRQLSNNYLNSQSSSKDQIFFLTNINSNKKHRKTYTEPIQEFHFNLSSIMNFDTSTYANQNCSSQIKENQNENSSKVKLKTLIYSFVDQLDCMQECQVDDELVQELQSVMKKIVSKQQQSARKWQKNRMNTEQSTSSDFKIFRNSIMQDRTNKMNEQKYKKRKTYMQGTISSSAKSLQIKQWKQLAKSRNKQNNIKDTRLKNKNKIYLKQSLDTNRTKKSITARKLF